MEPSTRTSADRWRLLDRLAIGLLIGVAAVSVGGVALLTVYFDRLSDAVDELPRDAALSSYAGRPSAVSVDGVSAVNYLLMTTGADGELEAVVIAHLSAPRRDLTLVALPSNLRADNGSEQVTLQESFAQNPVLAARAVETLTEARMDYQLRAGLDGFGHVIDSLGGITMDSRSMDGAELVAYLEGAADPLERSVRTAELFRSALARAHMGVTIADPNRFDKVMDALTPCLRVDENFTSTTINETMIEWRVRADDVVTWPLPASAGAAGAEADPEVLAQLREALANDVFPSPAPTPGAASVSSTVPPTSATKEPDPRAQSGTGPSVGGSPTTSPHPEETVRNATGPSPAATR